MITASEQLLVTKEINNIVVAFAKDKVLRKLITQFAFENNTNKPTDLLQTVSFYHGDIPPPEEHLTILELVWDFQKQLTKEEETALHYWVLNQEYMNYFDNAEAKDLAPEDYDAFDTEFGRELAHRLYNSKETRFEEDIEKQLKYLLINFASELDLSSIDEYTEEHILEIIDNYCS
ncbi:hypothetical protein [Tenacibaculum sp.]|uniref:hypothetical protein n=1 Tax=Tenacibaculum sp. TaxID=1906242 RepID=UPI003AA8AA36